MPAPLRTVIWQRETGKQVLISLRDAKILDTLALEPAQFQLALRQYAEKTLYPKISDFCSHVETRLMEDDLPDELSCKAMLTGHPKLLMMADQLEALLGAWVQDDETLAAIEKLREDIKAIL